MKKWEKTWPLAALLSVGLVAASADELAAQISFGQMRDAAKKTAKPRPGADDKSDSADDESDEEDVFDVDPNERAEKPRASSAAPKTSTGRTTLRPRTAAKDDAEKEAPETNGIADALSEPLVDDEKTPNAAASANSSRRTPTTRNSATKTDKNGKDDAKKSGAAKRGPVLGVAKTTKYRAGMIFEARQNGTCSNLLGTAPVPTDFPEQKVRTLDENFPRVARVDYRDLKEGGARQMVFKMRQLKPGQRVEATALFEVTRYPLLPPTEPEIYAIPKSPNRDIRRYLKEGPYIESNAKTVRRLAKEITENVDGDWEKVAAILKYVRENITYKELQIEKPMRGALAALRTKDGDCEDMSALFIALCRSLDIPARLVRVPGHCWAEFYLVDDDKNGYWFPAQVAGTEELGSLQDVRVILQKGDNFNIPDSDEKEALYVKELFTGSVKEGAPDPIYQFIQESNAK